MAQNIEILSKLRDSIIEGEQDHAVQVAKEALDLGLDYKNILDDSIIKAADEVGKLYEEEEYFLADLLMTGDALQAVMNVLKPLFEKSSQKSMGTIIIGTVEGDIHDIGKILIISLLQGQGFNVIDLGVEVSPETFTEKAKEIKPDIIGLSGLITTSISKMHETVMMLKEENISAKIIVGGGILSKNSCELIGADEFAKDGWEGIKKVKKLMEVE